MICENDTDHTRPPQKIALAPGVSVGQLVLLSRAGSDKHGKALWLCRCTACGKDTTKRADHLRNGRIKTCGCERTVRTIGRRDQMSAILSVAGVKPRFVVQGHVSPKVKDTGGYYSHLYAQIYVADQDRMDFWRNDRTCYYLTEVVKRKHKGGTEHPLHLNTLVRLRDQGWIGPQNGLTVLRWAEVEGVVFRKPKTCPHRDMMPDQFKQHMREAHIDFRGQILWKENK